MAHFNPLNGTTFNFEKNHISFLNVLKNGIKTFKLNETIFTTSF